VPGSITAGGPYLTGTEALMWILDDEPALRSTFISVSLLDRPVDVDRLRARMGRAVEEIPVLRRRLAPTPLDLAPPRWEDDPDFDLVRHVRRAVLPSPGTRRQLLDLAAERCAEPFDRHRPLWELMLVDGLEDGGGAMLTKMHHVLSDGVGAIRISASFLDVSPDADLSEPPLPVDPRPSSPLPSSGWLESAAQTVGPILSANADEFRRGVTALTGGVFGIVRSPASGAARAWNTARSVARQVGSNDSARSPLWTSRAHDHHFEVTSLDLDGIKSAGTALGGTVNDAFVTIMASAAGAYHRARGVDVGDLRVNVPISVRQDHAAAGNAWVPMRLLIPAGELPPAERFAEVHRRLGAAKADPSLGLADGLASSVRRLPRPLLVRLALHQVAAVDFACSNVRGAPFDLWIAGSHVEANFPFGPTVGVAFNATVLSYRSALDLGLHIDGGAVDDPALLLRCVEDAGAELLDAGSGRRRGRRR
jgi:diacylglycerol O-acyltransferase / wax synthase